MATRRSVQVATELAFGRYEHRAELGHGGSGRVVEVRDHGAGGALKALKIVGPEHAERLAWELEVLAGAAHPSLARVHELLRVEAPLGPPFRLPRGAFVLVEDRAPGEASSAVFASLEPAQRQLLARRLAGQLAGALDALHARGLAHGDVKPSNVVVDTSGEPHATLVDLGLALPFGRGATGGTPRFLAPEAWLGERSPATDLYALGATLHDWLAGGGADASRSDAQPQLARTRAELPAWVEPDLARLVRDCLAEQPGDRPRVAADVARALGASDVLALIGAPSPVERARRAGVVPIVGRTREVERIRRAIVDALGSARPSATLVAVRGPAGSGRTRVVLEAVRAAQSELARREDESRGEVPSLRMLEAGQVLPHTPTIQFAPHGEDTALATHRAASLSGARVVVIVEREAEVPGADLDVVLGPLGALPFGELLGALVERPEGALVEAWRRVTRGLPGVLVRAIADRWMAGTDPRAAPSERVQRDEREGPIELGVAADLALAAALAGGAIDARTARRVAGRDAVRAVEILVGRGYAERDGEGLLHLSEALVSRVATQATPEERRRVASLLALGLGPGASRALVRAALGAREAETEVLAAATALRDAGAPERAARLLGRARAFLESDACLAAELDALLAAGRIEEAEALGAQHEGRPAIAWLLAEIARRAGRWTEARARLAALDASGEDRARARASLARIALAVGGEPPELDALSAEGAARAFVDEARALSAQASGHPDRALAIAESARRAIELTPALPAFERVRAAARLCAIEASARSAMGDAVGADAAFERSAELASRAGERHATAAFLVNLGVGRLDLGLLGPALDALTRGAEELVLLGRDRDAARALYNVANAAILAGDRHHARHAAEGAAREAERVEDEDARTLAEVVLAEVDVGEGRPRAAERRLTSLASRSRATLVHARLAAARVLVRDLPGAREALEHASAPRDEPTPVRIEVELAGARLALAEGDVPLARAQIESALARLGSAGAFELRLRVLAVACDVAEAGADGPGAELHLRAQRSLLDRALASLPAERHAQFRALHARALAARPTLASEGDADLARVLPHARALVEELRTSSIAQRLALSARALASAEYAFLVVREPSGELVVRAGHGPAGPIEETAARLSTSIVSRCLDRREQVVSIDAGVDRALEGGASIHALAVRSVVALPLEVGERPAVLYVDDRLRPSAFGPALVASLEVLTGFATVAFANAARARRERRAQALAARRERLLRASLDEKTRLAASLAAERSEDADLVAQSPAMRAVLALTARVASSDAPVLITGESGTGKDLLARFVHRTSARASGPFVVESCAAIPVALLESTLFGHVRGAFSGAIARRRGLFELAEGGTLMLDEVGEMPLAMQAKLLRALSAREIRPIGSERARPFDVRVVAATHRDLRERVASGLFREDLFYRLAVVEIPVPPLRERSEDIEPLVRHFVRMHGGAGVTIEPAALAALAAHAWPGNVRELENEVRGALALDASALRRDNLSTRVRGEQDAPESELELDLKQATERLERRLVQRALERAEQNVTQAARLLGLSRFGLQKMMSRQGTTRRR